MGVLAFLQIIGFFGSAIFVVFAIGLFIIQKATTTPYPFIKRYKEEKYFLDPETIEKTEFPSIEDEPTIDLSVIVPAYEEEKRLSKMLDECLAFLEGRAISYEVIIVSDGSQDNTVGIAIEYSQRYTANKVRVLDLIENRGKGGAVRLGMMSARGRYLLFADADGATKFSDFVKLEDALKDLCSGTLYWKQKVIAIGSRAHLEEQAIATRNTFRIILMHGFHFLVWLFAVKNIRDTQCGFKLLTRSAARAVFTNLHVERWAFDAELLYIAQKLNIPIAEVAVNWTEIEGSKLIPFWSWLQMGTDLFLIWFRYTIGAWQLNKSHEN